MKLYDSGIYLVNGRDIVEEENMTQPVSEKKQPEIQWLMVSWKHTILPEICRNCRLNLTS